MTERTAHTQLPGDNLLPKKKVKCPFCPKEFDTVIEMIKHDDEAHE